MLTSQLEIRKPDTKDNIFKTVYIFQTFVEVTKESQGSEITLKDCGEIIEIIQLIESDLIALINLFYTTLNQSRK